MRALLVWVGCVAGAMGAVVARAAEPEPLAGTKPLVEDGDLSAKMLAGWHKFVERKLEESIAGRAGLWQRDTSSREAYERSVAGNRERFGRIIGAVDARVPVVMERFGDDDNPALVAETDKYRVFQVRWTVLEGVHGEGLLLEPKVPAVAHVVALPDADQTPEQLMGLVPGVAAESQIARRLADRGVRVVVPTLISRGIEASGHPKVGYTNQTHREWIYRQAFHMGRHVIGYEVLKVLAAVDWLKKTGGADAKVGVAGYGEGGLVALYAAAADTRIDAALVSGYFDSRQRVWDEPLYRNIWGLLKEFGDAELATLIAPRGLVVEAGSGPKVDGPVAPPKGVKGGAAVGKLAPPTYESAAAEFKRIGTLLPPGFQQRTLTQAGEGQFARQAALDGFLALLGLRALEPQSSQLPTERRKAFDPAARQVRQVKELEGHVQALIRGADRIRDEQFLNTTTLIKTLLPKGTRFGMYRIKEESPEVFAKEAEPFRKLFSEEVLGRVDEALVGFNARTRKIYDRPNWVGYDVVMDVFPEAYAWGVLLLPKDIKPGEKRPVVVVQHGRNGLPKATIEGDINSYHDISARLADRGFVVFAAHNLYRGEDLYRMLNRKGNPLKLSMFAFINASHQQILNWLGSQPFVDAARIGFIGNSYGGESAVRIPPVLTGYALSVCSSDFNDWARKVAGTDSDYSFMFTNEWEMPYFGMGVTFNYAEMAYLMVPRPFMVIRGHHDPVAPDEWVAYEYAKVRRLYAQLGLADRTDIDFFHGGHTINRDKVIGFLHKHLNWPNPDAAAK